MAATGPGPIAEQLALKQRDIAVSEFFEKNKHILGFDSKTRALITTVKEAVDNGLDACEEAGVLPDISVTIAKTPDPNDFDVTVEDNGPGIVEKQIANVFGRLLYGSRFHAIRQARGQQGIGISAAVMYGQITTGGPATVESKISPEYPAVRLELILDTTKNRAEAVKRELVHWEKPTGTRVRVRLAGKYQVGAQSVFEYVRSTAIVNPHARITYTDPEGVTTIFERATDKLPAATQEIKPHPEGIELGTLLKMAKNTESMKLSSFLVNDFSRVGYHTARQICDTAGLDDSVKPRKLEIQQAKSLLAAFKTVKIMAPPTDCLSPIGEVGIKKGLKKEMPDAEFIVTETRPPKVSSGHPFQVEAGILYSRDLPPEESVRILRFANRVPLLYQKGGCVTTHAIEEIDWRRYDLEQRGGQGIPIGPVAMLVHVLSTNVPFTSESKEAIADIDEIKGEVQLALRDCARKMSAHIRRRKKMARMKEKEELIRKLLPRIAEKSAKVLGRPVPNIEPVIARIMNSMMLSDEIRWVESSRRHKVRVRLTNYTSYGKSFELYSIVPPTATVENVSPKPKSVADGVIVWDVKRIPTLDSREFEYELAGLEGEEAYDETELYVKGIDAELVNGAEEWKGVR